MDTESISLAGAARALYSASTELFATVGWSRDDQLHMNPSTEKTYPEVERQQSVSGRAPETCYRNLVWQISVRSAIIFPYIESVIEV